VSSHRNLARRVMPSAVLASLALTAVAALTACGGGGGASASTKSSDGLTHITVLRSASSVFEPLFIAQTQGMFAKHGLAVTLQTGASDSSQNAPTLLRGDAQFAMTDGGGFLKAASGGLPVQIVTSMQVATTRDKQSDGLVVAAKSGINSYADLTGKTVALPSLGGSLQFLCMFEAKSAGIDPMSLKFVALPVASLLDGVTSGKVDAAFTFATFYDAARANSALRVVGGGSNDLPGEIQGLLFASTAYITKNPAVVKDFGAAMAEAYTYANANPDAVRAVDTKYTTMQASYISSRLIQTFTPIVNTSVLDVQSKAMTEFGLTKSSVESKNVVWSGAQTETSTT
jgi:NitT/TauT family transport system substrate-binding protein